MIFRRIKAHIAKEDWFAVFIDFCIVVAGVFMAMQVSQWTNERSAEAEKVSYLQAIHQDVENLIPEIESQISDLTKQNQAQKKLLEISVSEDKLPAQAELDRLFNDGLFDIHTYLPKSINYNAMNKAGKLALLNDMELTLAFHKLDSVLVELEIINGETEKVVYDHVDPFLIDNYDHHGILSIGGGDVASWLDSTKHRTDSTSVIKTRKFRNIVLYRAGTVYAGKRQSNRVLNAYRELNSLLESRLEPYGTSTP